MTELLNLSSFNWIFDKRYRWLYHAIFWFVMYMDQILSLAGILPLNDEPTIILLDIVTDFFFVYFNLYVLLPLFLFKGNIKMYLALTVVTFILKTNIVYLLFDQYFYVDPLTFFTSYASGTISLLGTAVGFKFFKTYVKNQENYNKLKNDNLETELEYLKDQINPHFLFNALNGIYVQSRKRPEEVPETVLLLSDLLRYQLYDCSQEKVALKDEIEYLKNYLKLDKMRKKDANIEFQLDGEPNGKMIAPFVFLPFVENAIKHGVSLDNGMYIKIRLAIEEENIHFTVENAKPEQATQHIGGGIGLPNVKRRLNLLYPDAHQLVIKNEKNRYKVDLSLSQS